MASKVKAVMAGMMLGAALAGPVAAQASSGAPASPTPASPAPAAVPPAPAPLTAASFAALPFVEQPDLSPNGQWLAGLFAVEGNHKICMVPLFDLNAKRMCVSVPDLTEVRGIDWVNDDNIIVHLQAMLPIEGGDNWYVGRLIGLNRNTGKITRILWDMEGQYADTVLWTAKDGSATALVAAQNTIYKDMDGFWPEVYRVSVDKVEKHKVQSGLGHVNDWSVDGAGTLRTGADYNDDARKWRLWYHAEHGGTWHSIDTADDRKREGLISPVAFVAGTDHGIIWRKDEAKVGAKDSKPAVSALYEIDLLTQKDVRQIWAAPAGSWIERAITNPDRTSVEGVWLRGSQDKRVWLNPELAQIQADFDKAVPDRRVNIVSFSRDRQKMLVTIDRADSPGALYYYNIAVGRLQRIALIDEGLGIAPLNPVRLVHYKARDGLEIEAVLTVPAGNPAAREGGRPDKRLPVIVFPHGGPWAHDRAEYDYQVQFLAQLGYAVIQPNFRGSTGYGDEFERRGEGQMGLAMQDDLNDALKWAADTGIADARRACIVGASYGGYAAMWGLARDADLWRCGISISGVSNLRREVNDMGYQNVNANTNRDGWQRMTPDFPAVSPGNAVARIKAPLLLIHGKKDVTVNHNQSSSMYGKMRDAGKQVEFVSVPLADHYFTRQPDRLQLLSAMAQFLKKYNPAD